MDDNEFAILRLEERSNLLEECLLLGGPNAYYQKYVMPHYEVIGKFIFRFIKNQQDVEDIRQETFMRAFQAIRNYYTLQDQERLIKPLPWLQKIAYNLICDHWKQILPYIHTLDMSEILLQLEDPAKLPSDIVEMKESCGQLAQALRMLTESQQEIIRHRYFSLSSYRDIAQKVHCSEAAARQRCKRTLEKLHEIWLKIENFEV